MEVHFAKKKSDNFECGICNLVGGSLEKLELNLFTCEIYVWAECEVGSKRLSEIKERALEKH